MTLNVTAGFTASRNTTITTGSATALPITITQTPAPGSWLSVFPTSGSVISGSGLGLTVSVNSFGYGNNQTVAGSITVNPTNGGTALTIPVNMVIGSGGVTGSLIANPAFASLSYPNGNNFQNIFVSSNVGTAAFNVATSSLNSWLTVNGLYSLSNVSTGTSLPISLNTGQAAQLGTGTYNGTVTLSNTLNSADITTIPVTLTINGG